MHVCMNACMFVCVYVYMHVCMCECMYKNIKNRAVYNTYPDVCIISTNTHLYSFVVVCVRMFRHV